MGQAKLRGTLEERTNQATQKFIPEQRKSTWGKNPTLVAVCGICASIYMAGLVYHHKEQSHVPENAYQTIERIMQVTAKPGSTFAVLTIPYPYDDHYFASYGLS
jgi:hypothetical protein